MTKGLSVRALRIGVVVHAYPPVFNSGSEVMLHHLLQHLSKRGHTVTVALTRQTGTEYQLDGIKVVSCGPLADALPDCVKDSDLLITHLESAPATGFHAAQCGIPVVQLLHLNCMLTRDWLVTAPALTVCCSNEVLRSFHAVTGDDVSPSNSTIVVRPLVDPARYRTEPGDRVSIVNLCRDRIDYSVPGGLPMGKGGQLFWKIAEQLPEIQFLAVRGVYGDQDVRDLPNVEVLEHVSSAKMRDEVYARTRILLVPSAYEAWGRVGTEAIVSGIPVIASTTPGLMESLGEAGTFVDTSDVDGWIRAITQLTTPARWHAASQKALARSAELERANDLNIWHQHIERVAA
ncbi:glycosyltransferase family 4 protein [Amycolatopsis sp. NPDC049868]|uniref:glycosyltransferase family 4 protein n=1 Tax=Amycolatopsis sp. NPDC049868 TaxID=3363934 RepID=UPI0037ABF2FC